MPTPQAGGYFICSFLVAAKSITNHNKKVFLPEQETSVAFPPILNHSTYGGKRRYTYLHTCIGHCTIIPSYRIKRGAEPWQEDKLAWFSEVEVSVFQFYLFIFCISKAPISLKEGLWAVYRKISAYKTYTINIKILKLRLKC